MTFYEPIKLEPFVELWRTKSIGSIPPVSPFGKEGWEDFEIDFPGSRARYGMTVPFRDD